jgi:curved DNA-binding protein CbpA
MKIAVRCESDVVGLNGYQISTGNKQKTRTPIMNDQEYHYYILGLESGATMAEIRTAYRRLVKMYHPDRDTSLDAEVRYGEIQVAYRILREQNERQQPQDLANSFSSVQYERSYKTSDKSAKTAGHSDNAHSTLGKFLEVDDVVLLQPRIPFSWGKIFSILWVSLGESRWWA